MEKRRKKINQHTLVELIAIKFDLEQPVGNNKTGHRLSKYYLHVCQQITVLQEKQRGL